MSGEKFPVSATGEEAEKNAEEEKETIILPDGSLYTGTHEECVEAHKAYLENYK